MAKIVNIEIMGKDYPLSFSLLASKKIAQEYGSIENLFKIIDDRESGINERLIETVVFALALLMAQGCAYKNVFESEVPPNANAPIVDGKYKALTAEEIELALGFADIGKVLKTIASAINYSSEKMIEAESPKNAEVPEKTS